MGCSLSSPRQRLNPMLSEVSALRSEVAELKDLLLQVLDAVATGPAPAGAWPTADWPAGTTSPAAGGWDNDAEIPAAAIAEALAQGDRSLLHRRNKARRKISKKKQKGIYK